MPTVRLDKLIANSGNFTRSEATALIKRECVAVNGIVARSGAAKIDPATDMVSVDGDQITYRQFRYIMLNKPKGYVSSTADKRDKTVMELLDAGFSGLDLFPAGRLDKDTEGLLLLTNDGEFAHNITSPSKKIDKRYFVEIDGNITQDDVLAFRNGLILNDGTKCMPAELERCPGGVFVTLNEGKYHQVKRMMAAVGRPVKSLRRVAIGGLKLDESLKPGEYRELYDEAFSVFDSL